jgi:hypothetical protein
VLLGSTMPGLGRGIGQIDKAYLTTMRLMILT